MPHFRQEMLLHYSEDTNEYPLKPDDETVHKNATNIQKHRHANSFSSIPIKEKVLRKERNTQKKEVCTVSMFTKSPKSI